VYKRQQQVLLKVWKTIERFDINLEKGSFRNWIYKITKNTVLNFISKAKNKKSQLELLKIDYENRCSSPEIDKIVEDRWNRHISRMAFENISAVVSEKLIDTFVSHVKGEEAEVTAQRLGIEKETVYIYRNRIKEKLRAEINSLKEMLE
jgi:RNA polymerase sigma-70 factor (ECF subfamily)